MANNPYNNKVELSDGTVLMDLTGDTVTPNDLLAGVTAHDRSGAAITGTQKGVIFYGTCTVAASTQAKTVSIDGITEYFTGLSVRILFTKAQDYNGPPTLNINNIGAKNIGRVSGTNAARYEWGANEILDLVYDGTQFVIIDAFRATTTYYGITKLSTSSTSTSDVSALAPKALNDFAQNTVSGLAVYSSSATYAVGDKVRYGSGIYECKTAITTAESWTAAHWTQLDPLLTQIEDTKAAIPAVATATPLPDAGAGGIGSSTKYAKEDHIHPIRLITYDAATGSFLDWVLTTFTNTYDEALVNFNTTNYTGWPMQFPGFASIYVINSIVYIVAYQTFGTMWLNTYNGTNWVGWHRIRTSVGVYTYSQTTGNFLDYVVSDIIPAAKASNENDATSTIIIPFESNNYTGWPKSNKGYATLYVRSNTAYLTAYCRDGSCYTNYYDNPNWVGWTELAKASDIPIAGTSTPLPESPSGSAGSSTAFAKQDHEHPVKSYLYWQQQTDFLPWVVSTFTVNGSYYVVLANQNVTGLPEDPCNGAAYIYVRNSNIFVLLTVNTRNMYLNVYGGSWTGWNKLAKIEDIPSAATSTPAFITGSGSVGSSAKYAREDHSHPGLWYAYVNTQSHFLDWVVATFPDNGLYYVLIANGDYTGLPEQAEGVAIVEVRNSAYFIELTHTSGKTYKNYKYGVIWNGWNRLVYESDFVSSSDYVKMPDGTLIQWGSVGSLSFSNEVMISGEKTLPVSFIDTSYKVVCTGNTTSVNAYVFRMGANASTVSKFAWTLASGDSTAISPTGRGFSWIAIGKWK